MKVSYPAKIILFGEHSIVYKNTVACICAVDLFTTAEFEKSVNKQYQVRFTSESFNITVTFLKTEAKDIYQQCHSLHQEFMEKGDITKLKGLIKGEGNFFKLIAGYLQTIYSELDPISVNMHCQAPLGSGMGTSASIAAAFIQAVLDSNNIKYTKADLLELTKSIEDMQHGRSSGADPATVIYGGLIQFNHNYNGSKSITPILKTKNWTKDLYLIQSGNPLESTGEMVSKVREYRQHNDQEFEKIVKKINKIVKDFIVSANPNMHDLIDANGVLLEQLGIVSEQCQAFSRQVRKFGGAVKIAGAGGIMKGSGICIVNMENSTKLNELVKEYNYSLIPANFIT